MPEAFRGELDSVSLAGLLQLMESESLHGRLEVPGGSISVSNGLVTAADYRGLSGAVAAVEALVRARGTFVFHAGVEVPASPIAQTLGLVMESCRIVDELERIGPLHLERTDELDRSALEDLDLRLFARALDGSQPVVELVAARELHVAPTLTWLAEQLELGALREVGQTDISALDRVLARESRATTPAPAPRAPTPMPGGRQQAPDAASATAGLSYDDLIFAARSQARNRDYHAAEQSLLAALALHPGDRIAAQNLSRVRSLKAAEAA